MNASKGIQPFLDDLGHTRIPVGKLPWHLSTVLALIGSTFKLLLCWAGHWHTISSEMHHCVPAVPKQEPPNVWRLLCNQKPFKLSKSVFAYKITPLFPSCSLMRLIIFMSKVKCPFRPNGLLWCSFQTCTPRRSWCQLLGVGGYWSFFFLSI